MTFPDQGPERINPNKPAEALDKPISSGQTPSNFDSYMQGSAGAKTPPGMAPAPGATPMDIAKTQPLGAGSVTFDSLLAQANQAQDSLGTVSQQLNNPNLKLKRSENLLVKQKLTDANGYIRTAGSKLGLELPSGKLPPGVGGVAKFIAMINDGQDQLAQVQEQLKKMSAKGDAVNPGDMLSVQVKMGLAQQEISYTSTLLGKVIQSITQLMNTQL